MDGVGGQMMTFSAAAGPFDRSRFVKVLALAESGNDAEALAALRKAAALARAAGFSLGEAVGGTARPPKVEARNADMAKTIGQLRYRLVAATERIKDLKTRATALAERRWKDGHIVGQRAGRIAAMAEFEAERSTLQRGLAALEQELEGHRPSLDWATVARAYGSVMGGAAARRLHARARAGALSVDERIVLRRFASKQEPA